MTQHDGLLPIAIEAVDQAAAILKSHRPTSLTAKGDKDMASDVDYAIEHSVRDFLAERTPHIAFVGEESGGELGLQLSWVLDPIDGTVNFVHGHPLVCISLALLDGDRPVVGVIDAPFLGVRYWAVEGSGAFRDGQPIRASEVSKLSDAVVAIGDYAVGNGATDKNRRRLALTQHLAQGAQRVRMHGSAALDLALLACSAVDGVVIHGGNIWDVAAGVVLAREAGALVLDHDGRPYEAGAAGVVSANPRLSDMLIRLGRAAAN